MVSNNALISIYEWREAVSEESEFFVDSAVDAGASQAENVGETGRGPVVDNEKGQEAGACGVEPPD